MWISPVYPRFKPYSLWNFLYLDLEIMCIPIFKLSHIEKFDSWDNLPGLSHAADEHLTTFFSLESTIQYNLECT